MANVYTRPHTFWAYDGETWELLGSFCHPAVGAQAEAERRWPNRRVVVTA